MVVRFRFMRSLVAVIVGCRNRWQCVAAGPMADRWPFDANRWTLISGDGEKGRCAASDDSIPGARRSGAADGDRMLFGGFGKGRLKYRGYQMPCPDSVFNDLWKNVIKFVNGSLDTVAFGLYGTKGDVDARNWPGGRSHCAVWTDSNHSGRIFGGFGYAEEDPQHRIYDDRYRTHLWGTLNDLWRYDGTFFLWIAGTKCPNQPSFSGEHGVFSKKLYPEVDSIG